MRAPNWLWPRERNHTDGFAIRLGRVLHWAFAAAAILLIGLAMVMAATAILSGSASARDNVTSNLSSEKYPGWKELPKNAKLDPYPGVVVENAPSGAIADTVERGPDSQPVRIAGPNSFAAAAKTVDWNLLQFALGMFVAGVVLALVGRALRYIFSNE